MLASGEELFSIEEGLNRPVEEDDICVTPSLKERVAVQPTAWKPGVIWEGDEGEIITPTSKEPYPHWDDILTSWGYDPSLYEIVEPVKVSVWDQQGKEGLEKLWSYRAGIRQKRNTKDIDYEDLIREIKKHRPLSENLPDGENTFVVCIADTQFGKNDGDGLKGTVNRFLKSIEDVDQRIRDLRKIGRQLGHLVVAGLADIIENCVGNYASQTFRVEINLRQQLRIARRLIRDAISRWAKQFKSVTVLAVPGNHGANKPNGKEYTTPGDNFDVGVFESVAEIFEANPKAYGHVKFILPEDEVYVTLNVSGVPVGFAHGHISAGGGTPQARLKNWWENHAFGNTSMGQTDILITGHYHHLSVIQYGSKTHIMCPTLDGGSEYYVDQTGLDSPPGMLTLVIGKTAGPGGFGDLLVVGD